MRRKVKLRTEYLTVCRAVVFCRIPWALPLLHEQLFEQLHARMLETNMPSALDQIRQIASEKFR